MNKKNFFLATSILAIIVATSFITASLTNRNNPNSDNRITSVPTSFTSSVKTPNQVNDFTIAAEKSVESVVHVKAKIKSQSQNMNMDPFFEFFFGRPNTEPQESMSSGSGVIISEDGYIVTNNHVINNASEVEITLNDKRSFSAEIIGVDPNTDIALLKIKENNLPCIPLGNSDNLKVGEWVLAVGNPFNLTSTVTAGIVSAKARNINILDAEMKIEAFIQTDAAVNPGNSGGALVNTSGELIGINTAIASRTGSYSGYSFAVPISIASKVIADIKEFGIVQRAILGIQIQDIDSKFAKENNIKTLNGVYIAAVNEDGSADKAGLKSGDIITDINGTRVKSSAELQEQVGRYRPGDKISIKYIRKDKSSETIVKLTNKAGNTDIINAVDRDILGAKFKEIDSNTKRKFRLNIGLQVDKVKKNGKFNKAGIPENFIILKINNRKISSIKDIDEILEAAINSPEQERVLFITGAFQNGEIAHFAVNLN